MHHPTFTAGLLAVFLVGLGGMPQPASATVVPAHPSSIRVLSAPAAAPVRLEQVDIRVEVVGHVASTRVELVLHNPNDRVLEGELQFPLRERQEVTGFALDIDGQLRDAVPVDKARGQQVFEEIVRGRVDPALLEATQGRNHKLRVYPIPPRGERRVVLMLTQPLSSSTGPSRIEVPLHFGGAVARLSVGVRVHGVAATQLRVHAPDAIARGARMVQEGPDARFSLERLQHRGDAFLAIEIPSRREPLVQLSEVGGKTYFYAEIPLRHDQGPNQLPHRLAILWDASGSAHSRDREAELALLDAYFRAVRDVTVDLVIGRDVAEPQQRFEVQSGRWDALRAALRSAPLDGASNIAALVPPRGVPLALLFSDGLHNWRSAPAPPAEVDRGRPVHTTTYAISSSASVDGARLRALSVPSGGEWIDLTRVSKRAALKSMSTRRARPVDLRADGARDLVMRWPDAGDGFVAVAGVLTQPRAELVLGVQDARGKRRDIAWPVERASGAARRELAASTRDLVASQWAAMRIAELEADADANRAEIRRIGRAFGLVTRETSLIVLDNVADYVRHEIEPPAALRPEYERLVAAAAKRRVASKTQHLDQVARRFAEKVAWWERSFPKDDAPPWLERDALREEAAGVSERAARSRIAELVPQSPPAPAPALAPAPVMATPPAAPRETLAKKSAGDAKAGRDDAERRPSIQLTRWAPDSSYARRLRAAPADAVYRHYLDERPGFSASTAFFLDAADILFEKGRPELALRVLSNLAELELENRHILRVLGYRLMQAGQPLHAVRVFEEVRRLAPEEPQSHRDLGLAHAEAKQWPQAVDALWEVVAQPWDARFPDIDLIALGELNAVIERASGAGTEVRADHMDARLLRNLPLDLRIALSWDADNTDIDLWVTDPNGEKTHYAHPLSRQGGRISRDATGGYGPEEFGLRHAKPGRYTVQAQFFGHRQQIVAPATTLMMKLSTGFGTAVQSDEMVTLRLRGTGELVNVGSFEVK